MRNLLLFFCLFPVMVLKAQEPSLYFEKFTVENGLSHNKVNCILQDQRGFIWLGTEDGLDRYDGKRFIHFRSRSNDSTSISGNIITDLYEDRDGKIWIATADGGLCRYDYRLPPANQFKQYKHKPGDPASIPTNGINTILEDRQGFLWLGTSGHSVLRFDKQKERFSKINPSNKTILDLCLDQTGSILVGRQGGGMMKINPVTLSYSEDDRYRELYANLPHATITALFTDRDGHVWFGSWDRVLYRQNIISGKEEVFQANGSYSFQNDEALSFAEDASGRLWIGGKEKGLHIYDRRQNRFYNYRYDPSREGSLPDNTINCIYMDRQGRVWIGTNRGPCLNSPEKQQFNQYFLPSRSEKPITIYDFYEDEEGNIWIGTSEGIFIKSPDGNLSHHRITYKGESLHATYFYRDTDGSFYLGTDYSFFRYDPVAHRVSPLPNTDKDSVMVRIIDSRIVSVLRDEIGGKPVLITAPYGHFLAYYDLQDKRWISRLDTSNIVQKFNMRDNLIRRFYKMRDGSIWVATGKEGLAAWLKQPLPYMLHFTHSPSSPGSITNNNVYDLAEDENGNLWVSTYGGGLNYFDVRKKIFTHIPASNNLLEGIKVDHRQQVWMISNGHLHKYDPRRKTYSSYNLPDLEKTGGVRGRIFSDRKGRLYVAGTNYFIAFHPDSIREVKIKPEVYLTDFQIFNKSFSHLLMQEEIRLNYKDNYFSFEFSAPHYGAGEVYYSYQLEGFDDDWIDAGGRNYVSYPNLEGGTYVFKVRVTTTPGVWPAEYASRKIVIIPPFWKRVWFYILCAVVLALAVYLIYRYRINELVKRQAIRNKIAQDLHDNVGSTLSSISVYSQVAKIYHRQKKEDELHNTLEKISATSSEMISELNDTVWAINPRNDSMAVILQRMESFAKPLLASKDIRFSLDYDTSVKTLNLEMEKRKNFYLIFKEAVNNALKYAKCSSVDVSIRHKGNVLTMTITDDGKGFDLAKTSEGYKSSDVYGGGNGLKNMQLRAGQMKGKLRIHSEAGRGSSVELLFPIT